MRLRSMPCTKRFYIVPVSGCWITTCTSFIQQTCTSVHTWSVIHSWHYLFTPLRPDTCIFFLVVLDVFLIRHPLFVRSHSELYSDRRKELRNTCTWCSHMTFAPINNNEQLPSVRLLFLRLCHKNQDMPTVWTREPIARISYSGIYVA